MIEVKLKDLVAASPAIAVVMSVKLPAKVAYRLSRIQSKIQSELREFNTQRDAIIKRMGEEDPPGSGQIIVKGKDKLEAFAAEVDGLGNVMVKIDRDPIDISEFGNAEIDAATLAACEMFITDGAPKA